MVSTVALLVVTVGVTTLLAAASMWWRVFHDDGDDVEATVTDAKVVESNMANADHAVDVACEYRYDARRFETRSVVHPTSLNATSSGGAGDPDVPAEYREGAAVTVTVPPERPEDGHLPDPSVQATYRLVVPALAASSVVVLAVGAWLAL